MDAKKRIEAADRLREILEEVTALGEEAREIIRSTFPESAVAPVARRREQSGLLGKATETAGYNDVQMMLMWVIGVAMGFMVGWTI